jgi:hypothetical protein
MSSYKSDGGLLKRVRNWFKSPVNSAYFVFFGAIIFMLVYETVLALRNPSVQSVSAALTVLSSSAQVGATFAGFLIVGVLFLIQSRFTEDKTFSFMGVADIIFFGLAIVVFSWMALYATDSLAYVSGRTQVDSAIVAMVSTANVILRVGITFVIVGFALLMSRYKGRLKEIRFR